jgi:hypothetical protein
MYGTRYIECGKNRKELECGMRNKRNNGKCAKTGVLKNHLRLGGI